MKRLLPLILLIIGYSAAISATTMDELKQRARVVAKSGSVAASFAEVTKGKVDPAKAGIRMQADPRLHTPGISQGYAPSPFNWTDRGRVYQIGEKVNVPAGKYNDVLVIEEWDAETPPGVFQLKYYARGVGVQ